MTGLGARGVSHRLLTDREWDRRIDDYLRTRIQELLHVELISIQELADDVWLLRLGDGRQIVAKHQFYGLLTRDQPYDLVQTEWDVLSYLHSRGCAVPCPIACDTQSQFIFTEFVDGVPLTEALRGPGTHVHLMREVLAAVVEIEGALAEDGGWQERIVPGASGEDLQRSWGRAGEIARDGLCALLRQQGVIGSGLEARLDTVHTECEWRPPMLGATDYQPANVIVRSSDDDGVGDVDGDLVVVLEIGKLGWDWTERRILQYTTGTTPIGVQHVNRAVAARYGNIVPGKEPFCRRALDAHHIVYCLHLAQRWCAGAGAPMRVALENLTRALSTPLSDDPAATAFRRHFSETVDA
ncbi:MAG: hypothetical protein VX733_07750 [Candidatus Latescibacterota bacterium]|nr:hypothetical protein [Candidatus Latescibacterota bacterium]